MRVYLIRHPQTVASTDTCYGSSDVAVKPEIRKYVAKSLLGMLPKGATVYSCPLHRCSELAKDLAAGLDAPAVKYDERLVEMHFGRWELRKWVDIPRQEVQAWLQDPVMSSPGGGETALQMALRVREFHNDLIKDQHQNAVIVSHAGTIRMLLGCQRGLPLVEMARYAAQVRHKVAYGEVILLDC